MQIRDSYELGDSLTQGLARQLADARWKLGYARQCIQWALRDLEERDSEMAKTALEDGLRRTEPS